MNRKPEASIRVSFLKWWIKATNPHVTRAITVTSISKVFMSIMIAEWPRNRTQVAVNYMNSMHSLSRHLRDGDFPSLVVCRGGDCEAVIVDDDIEASVANRGSVGVAYLRPWRGLRTGLHAEE